MVKKIRLSHSALEKYDPEKGCPRSYYFHYMERLREENLGSALFFGGAIDAGINELLKTKMDDPGDIFDPIKSFRYRMEKVNYNGETIYPANSTKVRYFKSDYDPELLEEKDLLLLEKYLVDNEYHNTNPLETMKHLQEFIKVHSFEDLDKEDQIFYNLACWTSLHNKGLMIIEAFKEQLLPKITKVHSIQKKITLPNEDGDEIIGYEDFIAEINLENGESEEVFVCDNKTSSPKYKEDSAATSQQLTIYCEFEDIENAAYFVMYKKPKKIQVKTCQKCGTVTEGREKKCKVGGTGKNRCNGEFDTITRFQIDTDLITGKITEEQKELTFQKIDDIMRSIKNEEFPKKSDKKDCFFYGRTCPYYEKCWEDSTSMKGLKKL